MSYFTWAVTIILLLPLFYFLAVGWVAFFYILGTYALYTYDARLSASRMGEQALALAVKETRSRAFYNAVLREFWTSWLLSALYPWGHFTHDRSGRPSPSDKRPVLLLHGFTQNRANYLVMKRRFVKSGRTRIFTLNMRPMFTPIEDWAFQVARKVDELVELTDAEKIDIVGHSLGGLVARYYIAALGGHERVANLVTFGSPHHGTRTGFLSWAANGAQIQPKSRFLRRLERLETADVHVPKLSIYSKYDNLILPCDSARLDPPDHNRRVDTVGHLSLLTEADAFAAMISWLEDREARVHPRNTGRPPGEAA